MPRPDGRQNNALRPVRFTPGFLPNADDSVLVEMGHTRVICAATLEEFVPHHLKGSGTGWISAEYGMLPRSSAQRIRRERGTHLGGRTQEIQRLIGRSLRSAANLAQLGERTVLVDCDVLSADGGTRTASITGGFLAMAMCLLRLKKRLNVNRPILNHYVAAVSAGMIESEPRLDLCYEEDFAASVDMNVVMVDSGSFVEIQGSGEEDVFSRSQADALLDLATQGIQDLIALQREIVPELP